MRPSPSRSCRLAHWDPFQAKRRRREVPETPAVPAPAKLPIPGVVPLVHAGLLDVVVGEVVGDTVGIVGASELGPTVLTVGNTLGSGTGGVEPTPRLPISKDPNGIPV